jgi:hypothetical protein
MSAYRKLSKNSTLTPGELAAMLSSNTLDVVAATAATKVEAVRAGLARLVSFDTATSTLAEHKMSWVSDAEDIADIAVVGSELVVVHVSGLLVVYDPFAESAVKFAVQLKLPSGGVLCQLLPHYDERFMLMWCGEQIYCAPLWPEERADAFGPLCLTDRVPHGVRSVASLGGSTLFFAVGAERRLLRFGLAPAVPPGLEQLRVVESKRSLTEVEECERQKKHDDMQRYVQRKGLMLNLSGVVYTESSKPMGLEFLMDGSLEEELRKSQDTKPPVQITRATSGSSLSPKASSGGSSHRKSIHSLFGPHKKERRSSRHSSDGAEGAARAAEASPPPVLAAAEGKKRDTPTLLHKRSASRPDMSTVPK